jgi:hypothetical protein
MTTRRLPAPQAQAFVVCREIREQSDPYEVVLLGPKCHVPIPTFPAEIELSVYAHITGGHVETIDAGPRSFQPMNINFGLFPPLSKTPTMGPDGKRLRGTEKTVAKKRALCAMTSTGCANPSTSALNRPATGYPRCNGPMRAASRSFSAASIWRAT